MNPTKQDTMLDRLLARPAASLRLTRCRQSILNVFALANIRTLEDLVRKTQNDMLKYKNFGKCSLWSVRDALGELGLEFGMLPRFAENTTALVNKITTNYRYEYQVAITGDDPELDFVSRIINDRMLGYWSSVLRQIRSEYPNLKLVNKYLTAKGGHHRRVMS